MRNKKKDVWLIVLVAAVVVLGITVGFLMVSFENYKDDQTKAETEEVQKLKKELVKARKSKNEAVISASRAKMELEQAKSDIESLQYINATLEETTPDETPSGSYPYSETSETEASAEVSTPEPTPAPTEVPVSAPTSTPEETPMYTEFDDGKCYMDICGSFFEPGFGRVRIDVMFHDAGAPDDYVVNITGSSGAAYNSQYALTANWNASTSSLDYHGDRLDTIDGVSTTYEGITGSLRFDGPNTLYWTDPGTENYDRGPFTKQ